VSAPHRRHSPVAPVRYPPRTHVERFYSQPGCVATNHFRSSRSNMAQSWAADAAHWTTMVLDPRRTSSRIDESSDLCEIATGTNPTVLSVAGALVDFSGRLSASTVPLRSASTTDRRNGNPRLPARHHSSQLISLQNFSSRSLRTGKLTKGEFEVKGDHDRSAASVRLGALRSLTALGCDSLPARSE
jgi:hypothetical protein